MKRLVTLSALIVVSSAYAAPIKRASQPALSPDGETLLFCWQNDIWRVPSKGGPATRLTVHPATDSTPKWAPDGSRIAFASTRYGSADVYTMKPDGSDIRRVTFDSATESVYGFTPDGKRILGHTNAWGRVNLFSVAAGGGDLVQHTNHIFELQFYPTVSPNGQMVAYCGGGSPASWRNPNENGSDTSEIWVGNLDTPVTANRKITNDEFMDSFPNYAADGTIVWMTNRGGSPNLWRMNADGKGMKPLTKHKGGTLRWPTLAKDSIVYEYDSELWHYDVKTGASKPLEIEVPEDSVLNPLLDLTLSDGATDFVASPDGKRAVVGVRGDLFLMPERGGTTRKLATSLALDISPEWIDNKTVLFVSGRSGQRQLMTVDLNGNEKVFRAEGGDLTNPSLSPDGKWIAYHFNDREIRVISTTGGAPTTVAKGGFPDAYKNVSAFSWSPDSKWITFIDQTERAASISAVEIATKKTVLISRAARGADLPRFLPNGRSIYYTTSEFEDAEIMVVDLVPADVTFTEDDLDAIDAAKPTTAPIEVKIVEAGLASRVRRLTNGGGAAYGATPDSRFILGSSAGVFSLIPLDGRGGGPVAGVTGGISEVQVANGKAYFTAGGRPMILSLGNNSVSPAPFSAQIRVDRKKEDLALFEEMWWAIDRIYYDAKHHGKDWNAIKAEYKALVPYAFDRQDYYALMYEMIEELDSSHVFTGAPPGAPAQASEPTGFLGVNWNWTELASGRYIVGSIVPQSPADHPAMQLKPGDRVTAVDGVALGQDTTFAELLKGKAGQRVRLSVTRGGMPITVAIKPASPGVATSLRYEEFVSTVRAQVEKASNGKLTYFHIQGMNAPSTDRFFREMRMYGEGKEGAIVDVRWNGGGNTANRILAAMRITPWLYRKFRSWPEMSMTEDMFRGEAIEMPLALMTNQYSASNAEIFSEGFRQMKIGPVIGEPTGGNVLTVGGTYRFWDGGEVQIPFVGILAVNGEPLERIGRKVDVDVRYDPNAWIAGRDNQVEAATKELLKKVK
ncbi:MAG: PD40 domain-containing protein [Chthonomonas sp.]|nr:PD40 domain-containing protein [Chthonomonas sp.]